MGIQPPPPWGGNERARVEGNVDMHNLDTEHVHAIYCDEHNSGSLLGGGVTARSMDIKATV